MKIPLHSTTDLITNSSTVIFTYSESSESALVEMINEVFKTFGINKTCEDVFQTVVLTDGYRYLESEDSEGMTSEQVNQLYADVLTGKIEKPEWFKNAEEHENYEYFTPDTYLHLIPKKEEYKKLATLIKNFLYSTDHEAQRDG